MSELILMVGLPYSGKSTIAQSFKHPIVCPDQIRFALHNQRYEPLAEPMVWAMAKIFVRSLFLAGHKYVILDACNTTSERRDAWTDVAWTRSYVVCDISKVACMLRAQEHNDNEIMPIIDRMSTYLEFDGILYGDNSIDSENPWMIDHIQYPDGKLKHQIYHKGKAAADAISH